MWRRLLRRLFGSETHRDRPDQGTGPDRGGGGDHASPPPVHRAWADVPPLRTGRHRPMPNVSRIDRFSGALVDRHRGVRHLAPLGHAVTPDAPSGIVGGLTRAVDVEPSRPPVRELPLAQPAGPRRRPQPATTLVWPTDSRQATRSPSTTDHSPEVVTSHTTGPADPHPATSPPAPKAPSTADDPPPRTERPVTGSPPGPPEQGRRPREQTEPAATGTTADGPSEDVEALGARADATGTSNEATPGDDGPPRDRPTAATSAPLVHHAPRVLRSVASTPPTRAVRSRAPAPSDLPLRRLAVRPGSAESEGMPPAADRPESEPPSPEPAGAAGSQVAEAGPRPAPDDSVEAPSGPPTDHGPEEPPAADEAPADGPDRVRPTLGGPGRRPLVQPSDPPPTPASPTTPQPRATPGVGAPLDALPASARPLREGGRPGLPPVTGHGRGEAIHRGLQRLSGPSGPGPDGPTSTGPDGRAAGTGRPSRGRDGPTRAPDRAVPPVVARRLDPTVASPARNRPTAVLPLAGHRPPLVDTLDGLGEHGTDELAGAAAVPVRWPPVRDGSDAGPSGDAADDGRAVDGTSEPPRGSSREPAASTQGSTTAPGTGAPRVLRATSDHADRGVRPTREGVPAARPAPLPTRRGTVESTSPDDQDSHHGLGDLPTSFSSHPLVQRLRSSGPERSTNGSRPEPGPGPRPTLPVASGPQSPPTLTETLVARSTDQRPDAGTEPVTAPEPTPVVQRAPIQDTPTAAEPPGAEPRGPDVGALFDELYPRVLDEIRWDLRVQRERAGMLTDPL